MKSSAPFPHGRHTDLRLNRNVNGAVNPDHNLSLVGGNMVRGGVEGESGVLNIRLPNQDDLDFTSRNIRRMGAEQRGVEYHRDDLSACRYRCRYDRLYLVRVASRAVEEERAQENFSVKCPSAGGIDQYPDASQAGRLKLGDVKTQRRTVAEPNFRRSL